MNQKRYPTLAKIRKQMNEAASNSGLSYEQIGMSMGNKKSTARKIIQKLLTDEKCSFNPRLETMIKFAKAVKKPLEYFF